MDKITKDYLTKYGYKSIDELGKYEKQSLDLLHGFVQCDSFCQAKEEPKTYKEAIATLEHYKNHSYLSGCSHGC